MSNISNIPRPEDVDDMGAAASDENGTRTFLTQILVKVRRCRKDLRQATWSHCLRIHSARPSVNTLEHLPDDHGNTPFACLVAAKMPEAVLKTGGR